jgi:regulator of protease activity HflC (stomatin/prohibitin superfamily)
MDLTTIIIGVLVLLLLAMSITTVQQGTVYVITMFGKYQRLMAPGLWCVST